MIKNAKHVIWSEDIGDLEDWVNEEGNQMSYEEASQLNQDYLDDERMNLDVATDGEIICIGNIELWTGRKSGYQLVGHNVKNILSSRMNGISYNHWYDDGKDICQKEEHHDGTNIYVYRVLKGKTHDEQVENAEKLFSKPLTPHRISAYTKSLQPVVAGVYGW